MNRISPYTRLLRKLSGWVGACLTRKRVGMWHYPKDKLSHATYELLGLWERVAAAEQLGWDVHLLARPDGLHVEYVERVPPCPPEIERVFDDNKAGV